MTLVKICGITRDIDIHYVNEAGPDMVGFILCQGFRRTVDPEDAKRMRESLRGPIGSVGVFMDQPVEEVVGIADHIGLDMIQLHGSESDDYIRILKGRTDKTVIKAFRIEGREDVTAARDSAADLVLLDGGTGDGRTFDWSIIEGFGRDYILAGGLTPQNVGEAVRTLRPYAVDTSSGVETEQFKDENKIGAFIKAARATEGNRR
jgi:phosphoribosylanthranilate isomerase